MGQHSIFDILFEANRGLLIYLLQILNTLLIVTIVYLQELFTTVPTSSMYSQPTNDMDSQVTHPRQYDTYMQPQQARQRDVLQSGKCYCWPETIA